MPTRARLWLSRWTAAMVCSRSCRPAWWQMELPGCGRWRGWTSQESVRRLRRAGTSPPPSFLVCPWAHL